LRDWGYRVWRASLSLDGSGVDSDLGPLNVTNEFATGLSSYVRFNRESEDRTWTLGCGVSGNYRRSHSGTEFNERVRKNAGAQVYLDGAWREYLVRDRIP